VSSCIYIAICTTFLVFLIPQFVKRQQHKTISYDSIFYLSFVGVIIMLAVNALFVKDAFLYSIALMVNLGFDRTLNPRAFGNISCPRPCQALARIRMRQTKRIFGDCFKYSFC
jgi:hypothetical protein